MMTPSETLGFSGRRVTNRLAECAATNQLLADLKPKRFLVIHQTSLARKGQDNPLPVPDDQLDGMTLARIFRENPKPPPDGLGTGGWCPYTILISPGGRIEQLMPLRAVCAGAIGYNRSGINIALVGDFAEKPPGVSQMRALVKVCAELVPIGLLSTRSGLVMGGHTSTFQGTSRDPDKLCPGPYLSIAELTRRVVEKLPQEWRGYTPDEVLTLLRLGGYVA
jgi:hypothetical protein